MKNSRFKQFGILWLIGIIICVSSATLVSCTESSSSKSTPSSVSEKQEEKAPLVVTVDVLVDQLNENALKAAKTYKDQYVELTGKLSNIDSDGSYFSLGTLSGENMFDTVQCRIKENHLDQVMEFVDDQEVTAIGTITSVGDFMGYTLKVESIK